MRSSRFVPRGLLPMLLVAMLYSACGTGIGHDDADGDGILNGLDVQPLNVSVCGIDTDNDGCDDCSSGSEDPLNDGPDLDGDGLCDAGDDDDDGDGIPDGHDLHPDNPQRCGIDSDGDSCDDCSSGVYAPHDDGPDYDGDGLCDRGDPDVDNDGWLNLQEMACGADPYDASSVPADTDGDGVCDALDADKRVGGGG